MSILLNVGEADFAALRSNHAYYVDKTKILHDLVKNSGNKVTLITRPRRFGKTLMLSMLENFFSIRKDSKALFDGLSVAQDADFCKNWMNQYPVLFFSLKDVEGNDFESAYRMLKTKLADMCKELASVFVNAPVDKDDMEIFLKLKATTAEEDKVKNSLKTIMRMLNATYGKPVILLIDEYDVPLAKASEKNTETNSYYEKMLTVVQSIMSTALKDNEFLKFAVITGCLRIAKKSIFTGANNFAPYSILDNGFSEYFGFSESEVKELLAEIGNLEKEKIVSERYDGYLFGDSRVYCPWDVMRFAAELQTDKNAKPKNYWKNTNHNGVLLTFAKRTDFRVSGKFETLLNGGSITQTITDELTYDTLETSEDNLWSVIFMTGYLTKADESNDNKITLRIPNKEIFTIFEDAVVRLFRDTLDTSKQKSLMDALWHGDGDKASSRISDLLWKTISYNNYHEDYYHAFLTGVFVGLGYEVETDREHGLGRTDIVLKDTDNRRAIIIEAKKSRTEGEMDANCDAALNQIRNRRYANDLYGFTMVLCYGVAFFQKQAKVKLLSMT